MVHDVLAAGSGTLVGFVLGLIGGGGSILAVPLLIYGVGVQSTHVAIGTSAVAVALSALSSLVVHARAGNVHWPCALVFAACGVVGAGLGSTIGKSFDGQRLLFLFGLLMIAIALLMLRKPKGEIKKFVPLTRESVAAVAPRLAVFGGGAGLFAGFFGIGGGFLVVPGLTAGARMPLLAAIGSSLVSVFAFGLTTATNYALSGLIDWRLVAMFVLGGIAGSLFGGHIAARLARQKRTLSIVFAVIVASVGIYIVVRGLFG
ncbi:sulfite exporter TauE/SafE family protein [Nitrobacter sp.]|uniref:sulfite exporter TauE/SafE family protein n=1 Tax=Nitrobacter sp. TaxID=29420 RepID=UPI0029CAB61C|nr:sulfite exporter TauE/SafE family protein [Nitrobacter sp.]